jgi:hypothetical protein
MAGGEADGSVPDGAAEAGGVGDAHACSSGDAKANIKGRLTMRRS